MTRTEVVKELIELSLDLSRLNGVIANAVSELLNVSNDDSDMDYYEQLRIRCAANQINDHLKAYDLNDIQKRVNEITNVSHD